MTTDNERFFKQCYEDVNKELRAMESAHAREIDALLENRVQRNFYRGVARLALLLWLVANVVGAILSFTEAPHFPYQTTYVAASCAWFGIVLARGTRDSH